MLGAMLESAEPYLTTDIHQDPRFRGWWPALHPDMRSFLGVPILARGEIIGAFYLTEKESARAFDRADQELIQVLAAHAAIAITNAGLYERSRELSILAERHRLALDLHDAVSQKLFSLVLSAEAAAAQFERDPEAARAQLERLRTLSREALEELRSLILGLRPPELERDGLAGTLRKQAEMLERVHGVPIDVGVDGLTDGSEGSPAPDFDLGVLRIAHEALHNAVRHAGATRVRVRVASKPGERLVVEVSDDGTGFDPAQPELRARHLGLTSMEERARELGGRLEIRSAPGAGTTVHLEVPR
jgi:signal transduction histidine kinase